MRDIQLNIWVARHNGAEQHPSQGTDKQHIRELGAGASRTNILDRHDRDIIRCLALPAANAHYNLQKPPKPLRSPWVGSYGRLDR